VITITFDFCSLNVIVLSSAHLVILLISIFAKFSASFAVSAFYSYQKVISKSYSFGPFSKIQVK